MADGVSKGSEEEVRVWGEGRGGMPKRQNVAYLDQDCTERGEDS